ncbi:hypothetical protein HHI36_008429, partial [Cryptolaemus montrouzieri]
ALAHRETQLRNPPSKIAMIPLDPNFTVNKVIEESSDDEEAYTLTTLNTVPLNELSQDLTNSSGIENS